MSHGIQKWEKELVGLFIEKLLCMGLLVKVAYKYVYMKKKVYIYKQIYIYINIYIESDEVQYVMRVFIG